ncbi:MAG: hypothetical protein AMXMBFR67_13300 [Nitrospira sp.]
MRRFHRDRSCRPFTLDNLLLRKQSEKVLHTTAESLCKSKGDGGGREVLVSFDGMHGLSGDPGAQRKRDARQPFGLSRLFQQILNRCRVLNLR